MTSFPTASDTSLSELFQRPLFRRGVFLVGVLIALWVIGQSTTPDRSSASSAPDSSGVADTEFASSSGQESRDAGIQLFTWGKVGAFLLLLGGGTYAVYLRQNETGRTKNAPLRPLGRLSVGQSQHLRLVGCGDEVLLIGVSDDGLCLLKTYSREAFGEDLQETESPHVDGGGSRSRGQPVQQDFADVLNRFR